MKDGALASLQHGFQDYILGRDDHALALVESTPGLSAGRRLDIYHNAYRARLTELLADTYERVAAYIGDDSFHGAALNFIEGHAPVARTLRNYGHEFPAFLAEYFPHDPEVAELAGMDLRLRNAFDAADADVLRLSDLASVQPREWDTAVFALHPTASFQCFSWNTPAIWQSLNENIPPPPAELSPRPVTWLFWRKELQPHFRSLSGEECTALRAIGEGRAFGPLCAMLAEAHPGLEVAPQMGLWLRAWLEDGVLGAW